MKNIFKKILILVALAFSLLLNAQQRDTIPHSISPGGILDTVYDRFGNRYSLGQDLQLTQHVNGGGLYAPISSTCSAGYFNLYFESGSLGTVPTATLANQAVICQVFYDISQFINSPLWTTGHHVNVWVRNFSAFGAPPSVLGLATQFYTAPATGTVTSGIVDGEVQKTIISGIDSYTGVSPFLNPIGGGLSSASGVFFHSVVAFNFGNLFPYTWNNALGSFAGSMQYDLYTTVLHEATHTLGFASLIDVSGQSKLSLPSTGVNYYSRYDTYLQDHAGNNLIAQSSTVCPNYQYVFNSPTVNVAELLPSTTTCTNDINFVGASSSVNQKCYTPNTWVGGSNISHMDDPCLAPTGTTTGMYYVMSYATPPVVSKRYHKPEEREILCNLGYNVNGTFGSSTAINYYDYGVPACPGIGVCGVNDGISTGGNYIYVTPTNTVLTIPINTGSVAVLANDYMATTLTCVQIVFPIGATSGTVSTSGTSISYTPALNYTGAVLFRYIPKNSGSIAGNITYITAFITDPTCSPVNSCNLVQNGGFETISPASLYQAGDGSNAYGSDVKANCWYHFYDTPDLYSRGITNSGDVHSNMFNLGTLTFSSTPTFDSHTLSGTGNDHVLGIFEGLINNAGYVEVIQNYLGAPLVPGTAYQLSFWAYNYQGTLWYPQNTNPANNLKYVVNNSVTPTAQIVTFAASPSQLTGYGAYTANYPVTVGTLTMDVVANVTIPGGTAAVNTWQYITTTFTYSGSQNDNALYIGTNYNANVLAGYTNSTLIPSNVPYYHYALIDDISILPVGTAPTFSLPTTVYTCTNSAVVPNLGSYATPPGGIFSGPGVTYTAGVYNFDPVAAGNGTIPIVYTYTNGTSGCVNSVTQLVNVSIVPMTFTNTASSGICAGQTATLTVSGASTYTWSPGGVHTTTVAVTPSVTTIYTVSGTSGSCVGNNTISVIVSPTPTVSIAASSYTVCGVASTTLTASGATNYTWTPTSTILTPYNNPTTVTPNITTIYSVIGSNPGCSTTSTATVQINVNNPFLTITPTSTVCSAVGSITLAVTNTGTSTYTWSPQATLSCSVCPSPIATPTAAVTVYTVTGNTSGCIITNTVQVNLYTSPSLSVTASPTVICAGQTSTLTATGTATSFSWSPSGSLTNTINPIVVANPTVTTVYTISETTVGCTATKTVSVTVNPSPTLTVTASPTVICAGQSSTLTASGGSTYTWSPSGSLSSTMGTTVTATPTLTTNYSVSGTNTNSCVGTNTVNLIVNPIPTISVSGTPTVCTGSSTTLTASGATNYTWSPSTALTCYTCATTVANPTVNTTYSITGTYTTGCSSTITELVSVFTSSCTGASPGSYTLTASGNYTTTPTLLTNNLYVGTPTTAISFTVSNVEVKIGAGYAITVVAGNTLTINNSWLHACETCTSQQMWQGIIVQNGAVLTFSNSIIEDAVQAVYTQSNTATTPVPYYYITGSIFNNNATGVYIDSHQGNLGANLISGTLFTCRSLASHAIANIASTYTNIAAATLLSSSTTNPIDLTLAGQRSEFGVYINNVNVTYPIKVGVGKTTATIFDNMAYGIAAIYGSLTAQNCIFQNLTGNNNSGPIGVGIYSDATGICFMGSCGGVKAVLTVGDPDATILNDYINYFKDCLIGVYTNRMRQVYINNNVFSNETTATTFTTANTYVTGQYGVYNKAYATSASSGDMEEMIFANNKIQNYATGHFLDFHTLYNTNSGSAGGSAYIYQNSISGSGLSNKYCTTGLYMQQSVAGAPVTIPWDGMAVTSNTITNVNSNCITASSISSGSVVTGFVTINKNNLTVKYNSAATILQSPPIAAVYLTGCEAVKVSCNPLISSTYSLGTYYGSAAQFIGGVYVKQSPQSRVTCNAITDVGEGFTWEGTCTASNWFENTMHNSQYGLVLRNSGIMGDQGSTGRPQYHCGDIFGVYGSDITMAHTLSDGSDPGHTGATSILYNLAATCASSVTTTYLPCQNSFVVGSFGTAYTASGSTVTLVAVAGNGYSLCPGEGGSGNGRMADGSNQDENAGVGGVPSDSLLESYLYTGGTSLPVYDYETHWAMQHYVNSIKPTISASATYANAKGFALVDAAMKNGDYTNAQSMNNAISPNNIIERNWKRVDNILIKLQSDSLNQNDVSILQGIAQQCPLTGGSIVYKARALLNVQFNAIFTYPNDCPVNNGVSTSSRIENASVAPAKTEQIQTVNLYPNPNNGTMMLDYSIKDDAHLEITDITGNLVGTYYLPATGTTMKIQSDNLQNGMYLYRVISNYNVIIKLGKIVVMQQ